MTMYREKNDSKELLTLAARYIQKRILFGPSRKSKL